MCLAVLVTILSVFSILILYDFPLWLLSPSLITVPCIQGLLPSPCMALVYLMGITTCSLRVSLSFIILPFPILAYYIDLCHNWKFMVTFRFSTQFLLLTNRIILLLIW